MTKRPHSPLFSWPATLGQVLFSMLMTYLTGFLVGDGNPSAFAMVIMALVTLWICRTNLPAALRSRRCRTLTTLADGTATPLTVDAEAATRAIRASALDLGLHWVEPDGTVITKEEKMVPVKELADRESRVRRRGLAGADRFADMERQRDRLLEHCRPALPEEYEAWTRTYRARGGGFTRNADGPMPRTFVVLTSHPGAVPELYGAFALHVIVPDGVMQPHEIPRTFHGGHGHSTFHFADGGRVIGLDVPHFAGRDRASAKDGRVDSYGKAGRPISAAQWNSTLRTFLAATHGVAMPLTEAHIPDCTCFDIVGERVAGYTDRRCVEKGT